MQLLDEHAIAIDVVCMDGSDDGLDFDEVEIGEEARGIIKA